MSEEFVVSQRLRVGGVVSGVLLVGGLLAAAVLLVTSPWWLIGLLGRGLGTDSVVPILLAAVILFALPLSIAALAAGRPGNVALRRRVLVMDDRGIRFYTSSRWWRLPILVRWPDILRMIALTESRGDPAVPGPTPTFVPWDHLAFQLHPELPIQETRVHLLWLTATVEEIAAKACEFKPDLPFVDDRTPPPDTLGGRILARRRKS